MLIYETLHFIAKNKVRFKDNLWADINQNNNIYLTRVKPFVVLSIYPLKEGV